MMGQLSEGVAFSLPKQHGRSTDEENAKTLRITFAISDNHFQRFGS
jgi:hypothetical protein